MVVINLWLSYYFHFYLYTTQPVWMMMLWLSVRDKMECEVSRRGHKIMVFMMRRWHIYCHIQKGIFQTYLSFHFLFVFYFLVLVLFLKIWGYETKCQNQEFWSSLASGCMLFSYFILKCLYFCFSTYRKG